MNPEGNDHLLSRVLPDPKGFALLNYILSGCCVFLLSACVSTAPQTIASLQIDGLKFENQTDRQISAVRLLVPATGGFVSCGNIAQHSSCSTTFPETDYSGNPVEVTWSQGGQIFSTGQFNLRLPDDLTEGVPAMVYVVIAGPGSAGAMIIQSKLD